MHSEREGDNHVVLLAGELDLLTAPQLDRELGRVEATDARRIIVDLGTLEFIDSTGMQIFIRAAARSRAHGGRLVLLRGPDNVHRAFELCGLASRLPFEQPPGRVGAGGSS